MQDDFLKKEKREDATYLLLQTVNIFDGHMTHNDRIRRKNVVVEKRTSLFAGFDVMLILLRCLSCFFPWSPLLRQTAALLHASQLGVTVTDADAKFDAALRKSLYFSWKDGTSWKLSADVGSLFSWGWDGEVVHEQPRGEINIRSRQNIC